MPASGLAVEVLGLLLSVMEYKHILKTTFWFTAGSWDFSRHQFMIIKKFLPVALFFPSA